MKVLQREARAQTGRGNTCFHCVDVGHEAQSLEDRCDDIMTSKCGIEYWGIDERKPGSGERCCSKNAIHVSGLPLLVFACFILFSSFD